MIGDLQSVSLERLCTGAGKPPGTTGMHAGTSGPYGSGQKNRPEKPPGQALFPVQAICGPSEVATGQDRHEETARTHS